MENNILNPISLASQHRVCILRKVTPRDLTPSSFAYCRAKLTLQLCPLNLLIANGHNIVSTHLNIINYIPATERYYYTKCICYNLVGI